MFRIRFQGAKRGFLLCGGVPADEAVEKALPAHHRRQERPQKRHASADVWGRDGSQLLGHCFSKSTSDHYFGRCRGPFPLFCVFGLDRS
jgi:hypothetical protein